MFGVVNLVYTLSIYNATLADLHTNTLLPSIIELWQIYIFINVMIVAM